MAVTVLRLGHRPERDKRVTTHCALVARAFGADALVYSGIQDKKLEQSIEKVVGTWGGPFSIRYEQKWKAFIKNWGGTIAHLTMYGTPVEKAAVKVGKKGLLIIVGGEKVPAEVYELAHHNIAITSQPHSEISALAIFLDRLFDGKELTKRFKNARMELVPQKRGKKAVSG